jgi:hypothetical protein
MPTAKTRPAAPQPPEPQPSEWCSRLTAAHAIFAKPEKFLDLPDRKEELDDLDLDTLLSLRGSIAPKPTTEDQLRDLWGLLSIPHFGTQPQPGDPERVLGVRLTRTERAPDRAALAIREYIARCAGGGAKREAVEEALRELLDRLDDSISAALDSGQRHENVIRSADFGRIGDGLTVIYPAQDAAPLLGGLLKALPAGHPLIETFAEPGLTYLIDRQPAVVLGPLVGQRTFGRRSGEQDEIFFGNATPRRFYLLDRAKRHSWTLSRAQEQKLLNRPAWELTTEEHARLREAERLRGMMPRRPAKPLPAPTTDPPTWSEGCAGALKTLPKVESLWRLPADEKPALDDLLTVRALFVGPQVDGSDLEDDAAPNTFAARRWASRNAGESRREQLVELVARLIRALDARISERVADGQNWAARRHADLERELAELRAEVAELRNRRTK